MEYYKIVDPSGHKGLVYKEGYNEDPEPWNPFGDCESGGIYFAKEDILAFLDYGEDLYEVDPIGEVYENPSEPGEPKKYKAHAVNLRYIGKAKDSIEFLVSQGADIHAENDLALRWAAAKGHKEVEEYLRGVIKKSEDR